MFGKKKKSVQQVHDDSAPDTAFKEARRQYLEVTGSPIIERSRYFTIALILAVGLVAAVVTIKSMQPLVRVQPVVVKVNSDTGEVSIDQQAGKSWEAYNPENNVIDRDVFEFLRPLLTLNGAYPQQVQEQLNRSYLHTRGAAQDKFREWMDKQKPFVAMGADKTVIQNVTRIAASHREKGMVLMRLATERFAHNQAPQRKTWLATVQFVRTMPTTAEEINQNPLGIYYTFFDVQEELGGK